MHIVLVEAADLIQDYQKLESFLYLYDLKSTVVLNSPIHSQLLIGEICYEV
jgi:hypothetical protein